MAKPQIVLIPGAWHTPECYSIIIPKLEAHGYTVHTRRLPSVTDSNPPKDLSQDIAAVQDLVTKAIGSGNDVVVIPHSWAGIVAGSALGGFGKKQREAKGEKGGVVRAGYMCAFMAPEGVSLVDAIQGQIPEWWSVKDEQFSVLAPSAQDIFYNDLPPAERAHWISKVSPTHSFHTKASKATGESWKEIPTSYLICEDDLAIPVFAQEAMTKMVQDMGGDLSTERFKCSHSPFLSQPDEVVGWMRRVAGEEV
ncbi:hypothetical protein N0V90_010921 [Kalmusia sp. IMI 367209]|nr:hypothetical protein N0V90_010921 [Kalmusia sp. IMI 367209]